MIFLPESIREGDPELRRKAMLAVSHALALAAFALVMAVAQLIGGQPQAALASIATAAAMAAGPTVMRLSGSLHACAQILLLSGLLSITAMVTFTGGEGSPALFWLAGLPILAVALGGLASGLFWLMVSLATLSAFSLLSGYGLELPITVEAYSSLPVILVSQFGLIWYLGVVALALESSRERTFGELRGANRELSGARHLAEEASHAKTLFLATMSHELRTPLTAILGFSELLTDEDTSEIQRERYVKTIRRSGEHLLGVITEILDLSQVETERVSLNKAPCVLSDLIGDTIDLLRTRAEEKGLRLEVAFDDDVPARVWTDQIRFRQVLINLVHNAIKFTSRGAVRVHASVDRDEADLARLCIAVADSGDGMTAQQAENVFLPFSRGLAAGEGAGLGLTIARRLAELLGGNLEVESAPGEGTTLRWTLGLEAGQLLPVFPSPMPSVQSALCGRVLLAEDNEPSRLLIAHHLERLGLVVDAVEDGLCAWERARGTGHLYDAVIMDIQMPRMDGCELAKRLRAAGFQGPILALTAGATVGERERCLAAGFSGFATKPIDRARLHDYLRDHLATNEAGIGEGLPRPSGSGHRSSTGLDSGW
jgi:signal transduction histidine kinase/CheY-like chemotaxis protein